MQLNSSNNGICLYLTCSLVLLACTNHVFCDFCIFHQVIFAAALPVADDRNLNLLQWEGIWQRDCGEGTLESTKPQEKSNSLDKQR